MIENNKLLGQRPSSQLWTWSDVSRSLWCSTWQSLRIWKCPCQPWKERTTFNRAAQLAHNKHSIVPGNFIQGRRRGDADCSQHLTATVEWLELWKPRNLLSIPVWVPSAVAYTGPAGPNSCPAHCAVQSVWGQRREDMSRNVSVAECCGVSFWAPFQLLLRPCKENTSGSLIRCRVSEPLPSPKSKQVESPDHFWSSCSWGSHSGNKNYNSPRKGREIKEGEMAVHILRYKGFSRHR